MATPLMKACMLWGDLVAGAPEQRGVSADSVTSFYSAGLHKLSAVCRGQALYWVQEGFTPSSLPSFLFLKWAGPECYFYFTGEER